VSESIPITADPESGAPGFAPAAYPLKRLMYWCVRRELWENRSIYIAPFATAALLIFAVLSVSVKLIINPRPIGANVGGDIPSVGLWIPYILFAAPVLGVGLIVAAAYCLGALQGERRDRSILFWKSLPVPDLTTVLSKASIPIILMPLISFVAATLTQLVIFAMVLTVVPLFGAKAHLVWAGVPIDYGTVRMLLAGTPMAYLTFGMLYGLLVTALWHAPIYAWLLLVGGWARRMTFVWAIAPVIGLEIVERIVFGTNRLETLFVQRLYGSVDLAFTDMTGGNLPALTPVRFITDPGLWLGFAVTALFLGAAVLLRRYRQPI
jgi:ABC-2 type transport system permease protein